MAILVIDFCLTKSIGCDSQTNYSCLRMDWASQDQCVQRKGRVGRVADGFVFRMVPEKFYVSIVKQHRVKLRQGSGSIDHEFMYYISKFTEKSPERNHSGF